MSAVNDNKKEQKQKFYFIPAAQTVTSQFNVNEERKYSNARLHLHKSYLLPNDAFQMLIPQKDEVRAS